MSLGKEGFGLFGMAWTYFGPTSLRTVKVKSCIIWQSVDFLVCRDDRRSVLLQNAIISGGKMEA